MTLSAARGEVWLTGLSLRQLPPRPQQPRQKNGSPGWEQDTSERVWSSQREFWGCEDSPRVVSVGPVSSHITGNLLRYDRLKTNHSYYISQRSAPRGHICSSEARVLVMLQPSHTSSALFWFSLPSARSRPTGPRFCFYSRTVSSDNMPRWRQCFRKQASIKRIPQMVLCSTWAFSNILA